MQTKKRKTPATYTIKTVANLSGATVRTLRFYDEIGLLKPAIVADNGYRHYGREELFQLQQILFFRELGFSLEEIRKLLADPKFDRASALRAHRRKLEREISRTGRLIQTIDKTLAHLEKEVPMQEQELYAGFDPAKQREMEKEVLACAGEGALPAIEESRKRTRDWSAQDYALVSREYDELHCAFCEALRNGLSADSVEVQLLTGRHYGLVDRFWTPQKESYIGLGRLYCDHPDFRLLYEAYDPGLGEFLASAMRVFAERAL
jgi:MerR family transcriptional regulator, thiopeptide resistance regulator